jgi:hypothetical protein
VSPFRRRPSAKTESWVDWGWVFLLRQTPQSAVPVTKARFQQYGNRVLWSVRANVKGKGRRATLGLFAGRLNCADRLRGISLKLIQPRISAHDRSVLHVFAGSWQSPATI